MKKGKDLNQTIRRLRDKGKGKTRKQILDDIDLIINESLRNQENNGLIRCNSCWSQNCYNNKTCIGCGSIMSNRVLK